MAMPPATSPPSPPPPPLNGGLKIGHDHSTFKRLYRLGSELGRGGFGTVYAAIRVDGLSCAVKYMARRNVSEWGCLEGRMVPLELVLLMRCQAVDGVVRVHHWFERSDGYLIVMERPPNCMDLFDYVSSRGPLQEAEARGIFRQVVESVVECKRIGVFHRDIKDENILIDAVDGRCKVIDFGSGAFVRHDEYTDFEGTRVYSPPEWIEENSYDGEAAAVWSLGVLLYDLVQGDIPFKNDNDIIAASIRWRRPLSPSCRSLISSMLSKDPQCRPRLSSLEEEEWLHSSPSSSSSPVAVKKCSVPCLGSSAPSEGVERPAVRGLTNSSPSGKTEGVFIGRRWSPRRGAGSGSSGTSSGYNTGPGYPSGVSRSNGALFPGSY